MPGDITSDEYIRWVKASLNRLLGTTLSDDGIITPDYRMWVMAFQTNQKLPVNSQVDQMTQNALIKRNRNVDQYVRWIQNALIISGEGVGTGGNAIVVDGAWGPETEGVVKDFQINHEGALAVDGVVGAKTETNLMKRTGTTPPGRPGGKKVIPPDPWSNLLSTQDRTEELAKVYQNELDGLPKTPRNRQLNCLLGKLSKFGTWHFDYYDARDVNNFITTDLKSLLPLRPDGKPDTSADFGTVAAKHAKRNIKKKLIQHLEPILQRKTMADAYTELRKKTNALYDEVQEGLNIIQFKFSTHPMYSQELQIAILHKWAVKMQDGGSHIYACFEDLNT